MIKLCRWKLEEARAKQTGQGCRAGGVEVNGCRVTLGKGRPVMVGATSELHHHRQHHQVRQISSNRAGRQSPRKAAAARNMTLQLIGESIDATMNAKPVNAGRPRSYMCAPVHP